MRLKEGFAGRSACFLTPLSCALTSAAGARTLRRLDARVAEIDRQPKVGQPVPSGGWLRMQGDPGGSISARQDVQLDSSGRQAAGNETVIAGAPISHAAADPGACCACGAGTQPTQRSAPGCCRSAGR